MSVTANPAAGHPRRRQVLGVMCLSLLIVVVDNTVLNTALPSLAKALHASSTDLQWITDGYTLAFAALLIVAGALGDRFGRRGALLLGLTIFGVGSVAAALSGSPEALIACRAVMGVGGAFVMPATLSILTSVFPAKERAGAIAAWSGVAGIAIVVGPTLGGFLLEHFSWSSVFWINVPLVAVALIAVVTVVPTMAPQASATGRRARLDVGGAVLSALGMLALIDAVIEAGDRGWTARLTLAELVGAAVLFAAFIARELTAADPLIDVRIFANRAFSAAAGSVALIFFALFGSLFGLTQYLQLVHGYSPLSAGLRALPFAAAVLVAAPLSSPLAARLGARVVIPAGLLFMGAGLLSLYDLTPTTGVVHVSVGVALMGTGMGLALAPAGESIMSVLPERERGVGSAVNDTVQELGGSLGVAVIGSLVTAVYRTNFTSAAADAHLPGAIVQPARGSIAAADATAAQAGPYAAGVTDAAHQAFTSAMTQGFLVAALVAVAGAVLTAWALPGRPGRRPAKHAAPEHAPRIGEAVSASS